MPISHAPASSIRWRRRARLAVIIGVLGVGVVLRVLLLAALPNFFGPGDPATYYAMANGVLREGTPRIDFIWNYASTPTAIEHVESYHEPAYAYVLAGAMAAFGNSPAVARGVATACGVLVVLLTFFFTRRFGTRVALIASTLVALEPWSIYYSGVLMKQTFVSLIVILAIYGLHRLLRSTSSSPRTGLIAAAVVLGSGLFHYELLPILGLAVAITIASVRRDALPWYLAGTVIVTALAIAATWEWMGVPISAKFDTFMGMRLTTPEPRGSMAAGSWSLVDRFVPLGYVLGTLILKWYLPITVLAWVGSRARDLTRAEVLLPASFALCFLYVHGVPRHLWERDFIVLLPVLAPLVALAMCRREPWTVPVARRLPLLSSLPRGALAMGLIVGAIVGVLYAMFFHIYGLFPVRWMPWSVIWSTVAFSVVLTLAFRRLRVVVIRPLRRALPALSIGIVLASYSQSLPWPWIFTNPQFPFYESARAARETGCDLLVRAPYAAVMTSAPAEVNLYSGRPAVLLPITHDRRAIEEVRGRYGVRYLLADASELQPSIVDKLALRPFSRRLGYVLYEFPGEPDRSYSITTSLRPSARPNASKRAK